MTIESDLEKQCPECLFTSRPHKIHYTLMDPDMFKAAKQFYTEYIKTHPEHTKQNIVGGELEGIGDP